MTRVLLTAFDPFGGETLNPAQEAVHAVCAGPAIDGVELRSVVLPVVFGTAVEALHAAVAEHEPDLVLCFGEAGGRSAVTPERFAVNLNDAPMPDNSGSQPVDEVIVVDGPVAYTSSLPVAQLVDALHAAGIPAAKSSTAGNYVCNNVFYGLMHLIATQRPALRGGFVHVPYQCEQVLTKHATPPSLPATTIAEAVRLTVQVSVAALDRSFAAV